jgi:hypothetical protein
LAVVAVSAAGALFAFADAAAQAATPTLLDYHVAATVVVAGDTVFFHFTIENPSAAPQQVGLGASIQTSGGPFISDPGNDVVLTVASGTSQQIRKFVVPAGAGPGSYTAHWGLYSGVPGASAQYEQKSVPNSLTIAATPPPTAAPTVAPTATPTIALPKSLDPGVAAGIFDDVDTGRTVGGRIVSEDVAESRAAVRRVATGGALYTGGAIPWYVATAIDKRTIAGILVAGGGFLPLVFGRRRRAARR